MKRLAVAAVAALGLFGCSGSTGPTVQHSSQNFTGYYRIVVPSRGDCAFGLGNNPTSENAELISDTEKALWVSSFAASNIIMRTTDSGAVYGDTTLTTGSGNKVTVPFLAVSFGGFEDARLYPEVASSEYFPTSGIIPCSYTLTATDQYVEYNYNIKQKFYLRRGWGDDTTASYEGGITFRMYYNLSEEQKCQGVLPDIKPLHIVRMPRIELNDDANWYKEMVEDKTFENEVRKLNLYLRDTYRFENTVYTYYGG